MKLALWKQTLPQVRPYYAVKCNPDIMLMKWLAEGGTGFDCASGTELSKASSLFEKNPEDFAKSSVFANPCKPMRDLAIASQVKSGPTTVDSVEEIEKLHAANWRQGCLIRIAVDDQGSRMPFSKKFGAIMSEVPKIKQAAKTLGQDIQGISFHVGSGCEQPLQYSKAIQMALLELRDLPRAKTVDIGGGFETKGRSFLQASHYIQESIKAVPSDLPIQWIAEPGRYFATEFQDLFVPVIGKKPAINGYGWRYTIDESLYGQFSSIPFDRMKPRWIRVRMSDREPRRVYSPGVLFGRTCDSVDMIAQSQSMEELQVGDWLWFPHMGAYTSVTSSEFNGFPKPKIYYTEEQLPHTIYMSGESWPQDVQTVSPVTVPSMELK